MTALLVRWSLLAALLVAELLALTARFDTRSLTRKPEWWAKAVCAAPMVPGILIAVATAIVVFGGAKLKDTLEQTANSVLGSQRFWTCCLLCHSISLALFTALTWFIFEGEIGTSACPGLWFSGWVTAGLGTLAFWGAAAVPPSLWLSLLRRTYRQASWRRGWYRRLPLCRHGRRTFAPYERVDLGVGPSADRAGGPRMLLRTGPVHCGHPVVLCRDRQSMFGLSGNRLDLRVL